ncbi:MAG: aminoacyl-tRNA hydrolase [Corynebacterium sp.]|nr:aminoacyl-tRNA hydrolase [Corynebacterium sp.]
MASRIPQRSSTTEIAELPDQADWLVIGLGNPGKRYAATRHNVGYMTVDDLLAPSGDILLPLKGSKLLAATVKIAGQSVVVLRSTTFMNLSGEPVAPLARRLGVPVERIIVVHDELDLPPHVVRLKQGGNENGHNGLKSLTENLGSRDYLRVRIGIGRPEKGAALSIPDWVLGSIEASADLDDSISRAARAVKEIVANGLTKAQNTIHAR